MVQTWNFILQTIASILMTIATTLGGQAVCSALTIVKNSVKIVYNKCKESLHSFLYTNIQSVGNQEITNFGTRLA